MKELMAVVLRKGVLVNFGGNFLWVWAPADESRDEVYRLSVDEAARLRVSHAGKLVHDESCVGGSYYS